MTDDREKRDTAARQLRDELTRVRLHDPQDDEGKGYNAGIDHAIACVDDFFDRINIVLDARVADGKKAAGLDPYGYRTDPETGKLVEVVTEQMAMRIARRLRREENLSLRRISTQLWQLGYKNRQGRKFEATQIARMLLAEAPPRDDLPPEPETK